MTGAAKPFDRATLHEAFARMGDLARAAGKIVEISVYGGSALVLTTDFRVGTRDVDAVFESDRDFVRRAAAAVADEFGWNAAWLNDGVKGFLSERDAVSKMLFRTYPDETGAGLRVLVATPAYLFAMKCLAMRAGGLDQQDDIADIRRLGSELGLANAPDALAVVSRYYPMERLPPKTQFGIEEIFGAPTRT
ncbi:MAG TPA: hypothetical protein VGC36_04760 [Rhizomicrobium sp.]